MKKYLWMSSAAGVIGTLKVKLYKCLDFWNCFWNNAKYLGPLCKMDLDFWDCFGWEQEGLKALNRSPE